MCNLPYQIPQQRYFSTDCCCTFNTAINFENFHVPFFLLYNCNVLTCARKRIALVSGYEGCHCNEKKKKNGHGQVMVMVVLTTGTLRPCNSRPHRQSDDEMSHIYIYLTISSIKLPEIRCACCRNVKSLQLKIDILSMTSCHLQHPILEFPIGGLLLADYSVQG